jgi:uncharacterized protein
MAFDTSIVDKARDKKRAQRESARQALLSQLLDLIDKHSAELNISEAYVFGSITRPGRFREESDIDVAVEQLDAESFFRAMSLLSTALGRAVDLVELHTCHFAQQIRERGIRWTKRS